MVARRKVEDAVSLDFVKLILLLLVTVDLDMFLERECFLVNVEDQPPAGILHPNARRKGD